LTFLFVKNRRRYFLKLKIDHLGRVDGDEIPPKEYY